MAAPEIRCSIHRSLDALGEKWSLLIVREALWGRTRFAEFRSRLGIAPDVLSDRLAKLVDLGVLEARPYREPGARERTEYVLTDAGRDLAPVLAALGTWGDRHRPTGHGPASTFTDPRTGEPLRPALITAERRVVEATEAVLVPGPGALGDPRVRR